MPRLSVVACASRAAAALLCPALLLGLLPHTTSAQQLELVGTLHTVWRDPLPGTGVPTRIFSVTDDRGRVTPVALSAADAATYGGFDALAQRRVRLRVGADGDASIQSVESRSDGPLAMLSVAGPRVMRYVTLLCRFPDFAEVNPGTLADAEEMFGPVFPGTGHYWDEVSDGQLTLAGGIVRGWYMMPQPRSHYVPGDFANLTGVGRDCAAAADADVDFSQFDGVNFVFNTNLDCCSYGGGGSLTLDGGTRSYAMTWLSGGVFQALGTISHEIGHSLGLSHSSGSYGLVYDSRWDVMSSSSWVPVPGGVKAVGTHVNGYGKRQLGFIPPERDYLAGPGTHELLVERTARPSANGHPLLVRIPTLRFGPTQYYTLEVRGVDGYDAPLGEGVVIHRVGGGGATASNVIDPDGNFDPNDDGALLTPGEVFEDRVNGITVRVLERVGDAFRLRLDVAVQPMVSVESPQRLYVVTAGTDSLIVDSARVSLAGMAEGTAWRALKFLSGPLSLTTASGTDSGTLRWALGTAGLAPGSYDQDLRVEAGTDSWTSVAVRLVVQQPPQLTLGVYGPVVRDSIILGGTGDRYNSVAISGPSADTVSWTVTSAAPWITIVQGAGRGPAGFQYRRATAGLAPGMHVAMLELRAPGTALAPLTLIDSLEVLEPLSWRIVARGPTRTTLGQGAAPVLDSLQVELDGRHGTSTQWYVGQGSGQYYLAPEYPGPIGSGWVRFRRAPGDLPPGTYPASIRLYLASEPWRELIVADTLVVTAAPVDIALSVVATRDSVRGISSLSEDSVFVQPTGAGSSSRAWRAISARGLLAFPLAGGSIPNQRTGPAWLRFIRNLSNRTPGWHVDTIDFLEANGSVVLNRLIDSLYVAPGPVLPAIAIAATPRRHELRAGSAAVLDDSVDVVALGDDPASITWSVQANASWITVQTLEGQGSARARWRRSAAGLEPGWHVDTIRIIAAGVGSSATLVDSLRAYAPLSVVGSAQRSATMGAVFDDTLRVSGGPTAAVQWAIVDATLPAGLAYDSASARVHGIPEASGTFTFAVRAVAGADTAVRSLELVVQEPVLAVDAVITQVLGGVTLDEAQRRYLDLQGNRNGRVDIGDVRAWRRRQAAALTAEQRSAVDSAVGAPTDSRRIP